MNSDQLRNYRQSVIEYLITDPKRFAESLYDRRLRARSLVLPINYPQYCCLLGYRVRGGGELCRAQVAPLPGAIGKIGTPYYVTVGDDVLVMKVSTVGQPSAQYFPGSPVQVRLPEGWGYCAIPWLERDAAALGVDEFTCEMLVAYLLAYYLELPTTIEHYLGFLCGSERNYQGGQLMEWADLGTLADFGTGPTQRYLVTRDDGAIVVDADVVRNVVLQVAVTLSFLQEELYFNHGDCKAANILVSSQPLSMEWEERLLEGSFTVKLADFGKSSLTFRLASGQPVRLFHQDWLAQQYNQLVDFSPQLDSQDGVEYYTIDNILNVTLYARMRHLGVPFYLSFDTYTFLVSLLLNPYFGRAVFGTDLQSEIWDPLFFDDDADIIRAEIEQYIDRGESPMEGDKTRSLKTVLDLLRGAKLKCRATAILLRSLGWTM